MERSTDKKKSLFENTLNMDRKDQYKHQSESVQSIRDRRRNEESGLRKSKRDKFKNAKRIRLEEAEAEYQITSQQIVEACDRLTKKNEPEAQSSALTALRKGFSQGSALIDTFLSVPNSMQVLVGILTGPCPNLQLQAAWCLTNIAAGSETHSATALKYAGPYLITYLSSGSAPIQDQCAWAIGNIGGGSAKCRETLVQQGAVLALIKLLECPMPTVVRSAAFALSNLARDKDKSSTLVQSGILSMLKPHMQLTPGNEELIHEVLWVLAYIAASGDHTAAIMTQGILVQVIEVIVHVADNDAENYRILTPALRCLGNICSSDDESVTVAVCSNQTLLTSAGKLLKSTHLHIRKETLWVISNLTVSAAASEMIVTAGAVPDIVHLLDSTFDIKLEAAHCVCWLASHGPMPTQMLVDAGAVRPMCALLKSTDLEAAHLGLAFTEMVAQHVKGGKEVIEESGGMEGLESLEYHQNQELREHCNYILETYFYSDQGNS